MIIDQNAPLKARKEIVINAPADRVWSTLTDISNWSAWQPDVTAAKLDGNLSVGAVFRWKAKGLNITSVIREIETPMRIGWTGDSIGMQAVHLWKLEPLGNDTRVITEESLSGWFPRLLKIFVPSFLDDSLSGSLNVLKNHAEFVNQAVN
jgi:uncharacterized protein YndB with AHSA1/START domain